MSLTQYGMTLPRSVFSGINALQNIRVICRTANKIAIFTDAGILNAGLLQEPIKQIEELGIDYVVLSDIPPEPTYLKVQELVDQVKECGADFIFAVGGGSVMDTAKIASLLATSSFTTKDLLAKPDLVQKNVPTCMIPTTAGTGAEATPNAIVAVPEDELKVGIVNFSMVPDYVILDASMIKNLPRRIAAATGVDAMAHAIECFTSNKANPFSDFFALHALELIFNNIESACDCEDALIAKNQMLMAAFYAGIAISCSGTTAVHALSYPLGGKYHIAHGVSNAILLVPVMRFNEPVIRSRLVLVYDRVFGKNDKHISDEEKSCCVIRRMEEIVAHLGIPTTLAEFNVSLDDLDSLVKSGMQVTRLLNNNMRQITPEDARKIYRQILS